MRPHSAGAPFREPAVERPEEAGTPAGAQADYPAALGKTDPVLAPVERTGPQPMACTLSNALTKTRSSVNLV